MKKYLGILLLTLLATMGYAQQAQQSPTQQPSILTPVTPQCTAGFCSFNNQGTRLCTNNAKCGAVNTNLVCSGSAACTVVGTGYTCTEVPSSTANCRVLPSFNISQCRFEHNSNTRLTCPSGVVLQIIRPN